ncbi:MAG: M2 family metallopeptidase, partial [Planctomycetota bacterium]|nr:M2 family metallopeptidase [Planctomycetota bacterium]
MKHFLLSIPLVLLCSCTQPVVQSELANDVDSFLASYTETYLGLQAKSAEADWSLNTKIVDGDNSNSKTYEEAEGRVAEFTGSVEVIEKARRYLEGRAGLNDLQVRQLKAILYAAARNPQTRPGLVKARIKADAAQTEALFGFDFKIDGKSVTTNEIDRILEEEDDEQVRLAAWNSSKEVGKGLKKGLAGLVSLRNQTVQALGYKDFFQYQVSDYGMTVPEMMEQMRRFARELRPLYREIHTWARYRLAEKFGAKEVPDLLPAH